MGPALFCVFLCLIQGSWQFSLDGLSHDRMVSDAWSDDILTDSWNGVPRGCSGKPADVYFVMDTATDTSLEMMQEQKRFLSDLAALFYLQKYTTRVGIVSYGFTPVTTTRLGAYDTLPQVQAAVQDTPRVGGSRRTAQALKYLRQHAFSPLVSRKEVAHMVILLTNGYSTSGKQVAREASLLRKRGVYVYVVSISTSGRVDKGELIDVASKPVDRFVSSSDTWNIVDSLIELLHIKECNYQVLPPLPGKEPVCVTRRPTELAFAVEHLGLGSPKSKKIISFIQDMLAEVDPESDIKAAILTSKDPISRHPLTRHVDTIQLLEQRLGGIVFPDLSQLLRRAKKTLVRGAQEIEDTNDTKKLGDVQRVLLVFLDDSVQITKKVLAASRANRRNKIDTYVVYVGEDENQKKEVEQLVSGEDYVIGVPSYKQLLSQPTVVNTLQTLCRGL